MVEGVLLGFGQLTEVDVGGEHREPMVGELVGKALDRGGQAPERVEKEHARARATVTLDEVGEVANHPANLPPYS